MRKPQNGVTLKVGKREFRDRVVHFIDSDAPVEIVTRRGKTIGVYVPIPRKRMEPNVEHLRRLVEKL